MERLAGARVFITGGAGFVGSHIADVVLEEGASEVRVLDDLSRGRGKNLERATASGRLRLVEGDIRDRDLVFELTAGTDIVFHQAALRITQAAEEPQRAVEVMVLGTQHVLDAVVTQRETRVISASSASVYGEASYLPMDEGHPFNNRTLYGAAKIANEQMHRAYAETYGLRYLMLRPFNVYGPRMDIHGVYTEVMVRWLDRLLRGQAPVVFGDGQQTMDFIAVEDLARAYVLAAVSDATDDVLNAGTGIGTSLMTLCELMVEATGAACVPEFAEARRVNGVTRRQADTRHAREVIGFEARTTLRDGLRTLVEWYQQASVSRPA